MARKIKIALYGAAGSGKDYVARELMKSFLEEDNIGFYRFAFADNLKKIVNNILGLTPELDEMSYNNEDFKNKYLIDLETLDGYFIEEPIVGSEVRDSLGNTKHVMLYDPAKYGVDFSFVVYTASDLYELCQKSVSVIGNCVIPSVSQSFDFDTIVYPEWYSTDSSVANIYPEWYTPSTMTNPKRLISYRELIVWVGTYCFQNMLSKNVWTSSVFNSVEYKSFMTSQKTNGAIITDLRFPHEYRACKDNGFFIVNIVSQDSPYNVNNIAESHYREFDPDFTFMNTRDVSLFKVRMNEMKHDILDNCNEKHME